MIGGLAVQFAQDFVMKAVGQESDYCCCDSWWDLFPLDLGPRMTINFYCGPWCIEIKTSAETKPFNFFVSLN